MNYTISECICPKCGHKFPIPRRDNKRRERGHKKRLFCPYCNEVMNMLEVREGDYDKFWGECDN